MNTTTLLWVIIAIGLMVGGREMWIAFRIWWIMSKGGEMQYRFKLYRIHYRIALETRIYIWRLRLGSLWQRVRVWWWTAKINQGYKAKYPSYTPPESPHRKYLDRVDKR